MPIRPSNALDQFWGALEDRETARILDLAGASQSTVAFVSTLGHSLYSDEMLRSLDLYYGEGHDPSEHADARRAMHFLDQTLHFPAGHFDGVLLWNVLECLGEPLLSLMVERFYRIVRPGGALFSLFHSDERLTEAASENYRVADRKSVSIQPKGGKHRIHGFTNRGIEKTFRDFQSVKFFLSRDSLREVLVRR